MLPSLGTSVPIGCERSPFVLSLLCPHCSYRSHSRAQTYTQSYIDTHMYHPRQGSDLMFSPHPFPFFLGTSQSSAPSQPWLHTCVHRQTRGIFPLSCQNKLGFLCGGLPERLQLCWWFSNVHICSSEIGQSQPFSFIGTERLSEDKKLYPCQDYNQPLFLLSKAKRPLYP